MKKWFLIAPCLFIAFTGCGQKTSKETKAVIYRTISSEEAKKMLDENADVLLLDVRSVEEFKEIRIPGAVLLPLGEIDDKAAKILPDKNAVILIYCRSGRRSKTAAEKLISMEYTNVYDMGGIITWPYDTEKD